MLQPGTYELIVDAHAAGGRLGVRFEDEAELTGALPAPPGMRYLLRLRRPAQGVYRRGAPDAEPAPFSGRVCRLTPWQLVPLLLAHPFGLAAWVFRRDLSFAKDRGGAIMLPLRGAGLRNSMALLRRERAAHEQQVRLRRLGLDDDAPRVRRHPEIRDGWPPVSGVYAPSRAARAGRIAVVLHLHYPGLWPEFDAVLRRIGYAFDLQVTLTRDHPALEDAIRRSFPGACLHHFPNRGRDIAPFLELLRTGAVDACRYVCKLQGKKSAPGGGATQFGERWRRSALAELVAAPGRCGAILDRFDADPRLGLVGPAGMRIPNTRLPEPGAWGGNRQLVLALARRMGVPPERFQLDFFAGSMFWFRPAALAPLLRLDLTSADFPEEKGQLDNTLQHAVERLFIPAVLAAGFHAGSA